MTTLSGSDTIIIWVYLIGIFILGIWAAKKTKSFSDYMHGGGTAGMLLLTGTIIATLWGGVTFIGLTGFSYQVLYRGVWYAFSAIGFFLVWAFFLSVPIRKIQPYSISEWMGIRFDKKTGLLTSLYNLIVYVGFLGSQFVAFGVIASTFMGWSMEFSIIFGTILVGVYTIAGGFFAVAITDLVQFGLSLLGGLVVLIACVIKVGTFEVVRASEVLPPEYWNPNTSDFGFVFMITMFFLWLGAHPQQHVTQRISSARSVKIAYWSAAIGSLGYVFVAYVVPSIGIYARILIPGLKDPQTAYPTLAITILPGWAAALVCAALMAVVMSSADSYLLAPASVLTNDIVRYFKPNMLDKNLLAWSRWSTVFYAVVACIAALAFRQVIALILSFLTVAWTMLPALYASTTWKKCSPNAAFWSMVIGGVINGYLILNVPSWFSAGIYTGWVGFIAGIVVLVVLSYTSPHKEQGDGLLNS
ncbi:MAG: sodium:solute symporter family protein [Planctomycetota bacterium]|jgi:SSS family solute:Na+ symporter|nr:sodium:solute symporter family protein [Planctomycetota bacterium]